MAANIFNSFMNNGFNSNNEDSNNNTNNSNNSNNMENNSALDLFSLFKTYEISNPWTINDEKTRYFTSDYANRIISAEVVAGDYGNSVKLRRTDNKITFIPLSRDSKMVVGQKVDITKCKLICLQKEGHEDIYRIQEVE